MEHMKRRDRGDEEGETTWEKDEIEFNERG